MNVGKTQLMGWIVKAAIFMHRERLAASQGVTSVCVLMRLYLANTVHGFNYLTAMITAAAVASTPHILVLPTWLLKPPSSVGALQFQKQVLDQEIFAY